MTNQEVIETKNNFEFIKRDYLWPSTFFLPIKRFIINGQGKELQCGLIFYLDKTVVILDNLFTYPFKTKEEKLQLEKIKYNSIEDLLADNWIVD